MSLEAQCCSSEDNTTMVSVIHLYSDSKSPPCRAVEMIARLAGSKIVKHHMDLLANDQFSAEYLELNPLHKVPFLVDGELKLGESRTIMRYLADRDLPPDNSLYPRDLRQRAMVDEILDLDSATLFPTVIELFQPIFFGLQREVNKQIERQFKDVLDYLELRIEQNGGKKFLLSHELTIADIALVATLSLADVCNYNLAGWPRLKEYLLRLANSIPGYKEHDYFGIEHYRKFVKSMQG